MSHLLDDLRQRFKVSNTAWDRELIAGVSRLESDLTAAKKIHDDDRLTRQLLDAALAREARLREALSMAQETMEERRRYADGWEWKYGPAWDEEDWIVRAALAGTTQEPTP